MRASDLVDTRGRFQIKDSGERHEFESGMVRDTCDDKVNYALVADGPMLVRWAKHLTGGAKKYAARNWMKAEGEAELTRFRESAFRHFMQWYNGDTDEDHASAVFFNINGAEYVKGKMSRGYPTDAELDQATDILSRTMESGREIGEVIEDYRTKKEKLDSNS